MHDTLSVMNFSSLGHRKLSSLVTGEKQIKMEFSHKREMTTDGVPKVVLFINFLSNTWIEGIEFIYEYWKTRVS